MSSSIQIPTLKHSIATIPKKHVLLVTFNRPKALNCVNMEGNAELDALWRWYDETPELRIAIITGSGRAFSAGADLKEWNERQSGKAGGTPGTAVLPGGFAGLSKRSGKKPIIAAVNGLCFGGGFEAVTNCDIVVAAKSAVFGLPEVKRGVVALAGALPRVMRNLGLHRASEMALTGRNFSAEEGLQWGFVNKVVEDGVVVDAAMEFADMILENSPDSVINTRAGLRYGWDIASVEEATRLYMEKDHRALDKGENIKEGLRAFVEKRKPVWRDSKL